MNYIIIFSSAALLFSFINYIVYLMHNKKASISFKHSFIFDYYSPKKTPIVYYILFLFTLMAMICSLLFGLIVYRTILAYISSAILSFAVLSLFFMLFFKDRSQKANISIHYIFFILVAAGNLIAAIAGLYEHQVIDAPEFPMWLWIVLLVISVIAFLSLLNPMIWKPKFVEKTEDNGLTFYVRKKVIWISVYLWFNISILLIDILLFMISAFFMGTPNATL